MITRAAFRSSCLIVAIGATAGMNGCSSSNPNDVSFNAIKGDLTPHIMGLTERDVDVELNMAVISNRTFGCSGAILVVFGSSTAQAV